MTTRRLVALALGVLLIISGVVWSLGPKAKSEPTGTLVKNFKSAQDAPATGSISPDTLDEQPSVILPASEPERVRTNLDAENEEKLKALGNDVALSDIPSALRFLQTQPDSEVVRDLTVRLVRQWAESNVHAAAAWAEHMPAGGARQESLNGVAIMWANQELTDATHWARQLPEGEERDGALTSVAFEAARTEPKTALEIASELPATQERDELVQHAALQWAGCAPAEAVVWAGQIPVAPLRDRVLADIATIWGDRDPVAAAQFAVLALAPGRPQDDAVIGIVQRWVQKDPKAAANWVAAFPEGVLSETASENVNQLWSEQIL